MARCGIVFGLALFFAVSVASAAEKPNIILILSDDLGPGDVGCYGGKNVKTPCLDRMAREGTRFGAYYSAAPICSPSRAGLITGSFPGRWNLTSFLQTKKGNRGCEQADYLDPKAPSLPRTLKEAGYATAHFGKWHLGGGRDVTEAPKFAAYGYDEHAGTYESPQPHPDITATNWIWSDKDKVKRWDRSAFFVDRTLDFLKRNKGKPCFVNLWPDDTHAPWVPGEDAKKGNTPENLRAVMAEYDRQIGRLLDGLGEMGLDKNTLVIFTSDNGPLPTFQGERTVGLRGSKLSLYEGGMRVPFIARWPGKVPADRVDEKSVLGAVDLFPTFCALAGAALPKGATLDGEDQSAALLGKTTERKKPLFWEYGRNAEFFSYPGPARDRSPNVAVRDGKWKLLVNANGEGAELYDVVADSGEKNDLAGRETEVTRRLKEAALTWRKGLPTAARSAEKPNIVVIVCDDMGFSDLGCYGGEIQTPNLDQLAAGGLRFTQFYNTARCCPTRASLLTGLYPHQAGIGHMMEDKGKDGYRGDLNRKGRTIAEALRPAGYRNYAAGKWHVTRHIRPDAPKHNWPLQRGFDRYYGIISGAASFYDPFTLTRDNTPISPYADDEYKPKSYYLTDAISDHAVRFVGDHAKEHKDKPFFLYLTYTAAHWPMHALPEDIAKYKGKYNNGYDPIREARFEKAVKLGLIDRKHGMTAGESWDKVQNKKRETACMEVYAAMIDRMDQGVGKLVAELKRTGQLDNTLILFLQDNGGCAEPMGRNKVMNREDGPRADKPSLAPLKPESLLTAMIPPQTRDGFPVRQGPNVFPGPADTFVAYGKGWATVSNTPFREYKHWVHEGGISTPLIAHWPAGIARDRQNKLVTEPGHLIDVMATCVDLAGVKLPTEKLLPLEGGSLRLAFEGKPLDRPQPIFWEHEGNRAVRQGKWKLVSKHKGDWELYDISSDRTESLDLSPRFPSVVKEMAEKWDAWAKRVGVEPWEEINKTPNK